MAAFAAHRYARAAAMLRKVSAWTGDTDPRSNNERRCHKRGGAKCSGAVTGTAGCALCKVRCWTQVTEVAHTDPRGYNNLALALESDGDLVLSALSANALGMNAMFDADEAHVGTRKGRDRRWKKG
eukprot:11399-Rhodomonas_salina.2